MAFYSALCLCLLVACVKTQGTCDTAKWQSGDGTSPPMNCGYCRAFAKMGPYKTCAAYCEKQELGCRRAYEDIKNDCAYAEAYPCDFDFTALRTRDFICKCTEETTPSTKPSPASPTSGIWSASNFLCSGGAPACIDGRPATTPAPVPAGLKIGMIGDQDVNADADAVLKMMKDEKVDLILLAGDIGYENSVNRWKNQLARHFADTFPFLISVGNHDWGVDWEKQDTQQVILDRASALGTCKGHTGVDMVCTFKGVTIVHVAPGVTDGSHDKFVAQAFAAYPSRWRICVWHKNQQQMQLGNKEDEAGWEVYEACRRQGAIIQTGHDHQYARTFAMAGFEDSKHQVHSRSSTIPLQHEIAGPGSTPSKIGTTFAFVNGLGGAAMRRPQNNRHKSPWWAQTLAQGPEYGDSKHGAVICTFNVDGQVDKAACQFKQHDGVVRDTWALKTNVPNVATTVKTSGNKFGTDHSFLVAKVASDKDDVVEEIGGSLRQDCAQPGLELGPVSLSSVGGSEAPSVPARMTGIRFASVDLDPSHAQHIVTARIQFTVQKETNFFNASSSSSAAPFVIRGEQVKSSLELCGPERLGARTVTTEKVWWQPGPWDGKGENTRAGGVVSSPNLVSLVEDIVSTGWQKGGPMAFFISGGGGEGAPRLVHSFGSDPSLAPTLIIELEEGGGEGRSVEVSGSARALAKPAPPVLAALVLFAVVVFTSNGLVAMQF